MDDASELYRRACAHEAKALATDSAVERREALESALDAQRTLLSQESAGAADGRLIPLAWTRAATALLLLGRLERAEQAFAEALALQPEQREARLGRAECALLRGMPEDALTQLQPLLDERPDGWILAALAAEWAAALEPVERLRDEAVSRQEAGLVAGHRSERLEDLQAILSIRKLQPQASAGPWGQLAGLMLGDYIATERGGVRGIDTAKVGRICKAILLKGRTDLLVPLLDPKAEPLLPGIGERVQSVIQGVASDLAG